jgi:hypothetical protein
VRRCLGLDPDEDVGGNSNRVSNELFEPLDVGLSQSLMSENTVYRFRLGGHSTITQTSGIVNGFFACDPSSAGVNFPEWSSLVALFSEFRLIEFAVQFLPSNEATTGTSPFMICSNLGTAANPGSYAAAADNADAKLWNASLDRSSKGYTHRIRKQDIGWSQVVTPTTQPYAGAPGCIQYYSSFASITVTDIVHCLVWGIYEFRSRV